ncbi:MAG: hypothetical protein GY730_09165 [bacterium]|nr:hypothetical protein [bacterium]
MHRNFSLVTKQIMHDIGNPVQILQIHTENIKDDIEYDGFDKKVFDSYVKNVFDVVSRINRVTSAMREYGFESTRKKEFINLNQTLQRTLTLSEAKLMTGKISLDTNYDKNIPLVNADEGQMNRVFLNIILNAIQAIKNGGQISIATKAVDFNTEKEADLHGVQVDIEDTGPKFAKPGTRI